MYFVKSFEETTQDVYGDLLSSRRSKPKFKVGLLLFGYFEYWRMFPDGLRELVEADLQKVDTRLRRDYDIVCTDLVDTLDSADISGRILKDSEIDALVIVMGTYVPDYISMHAIKYTKDIPLLIFSAQEKSTIDKNATFQNSARNSSMIGTAQLTATFRKIGRKYTTVVGSVDDEDAYNKIYKFLNAIQSINDIKDTNIGVFGNVFRGMYDIELSKAFLKGVFDVNVIYMQTDHLVKFWENTTNEEALALANKLLKRFPVRSVTQYDVVRACRLSIALEKLVDHYRLDALCLLDQHYIQKLFRTTARIGGSILLEERNIPVCCEGDIGGIVMTMLMQSIAKKNPMQGEWCEFDEELNTCLIRGHGVADPRMAYNSANITLTRTPEQWGLEGGGLNYEFIVKPGKCTVGSFLETGTSYSMLISKVESIEYPTLHYDELHAMVKVGLPVKEYLERLFQFGVTQHCILSHEDISKELEIVADTLNLEKLVI